METRAKKTIGTFPVFGIIIVLSLISGCGRESSIEEVTNTPSLISVDIPEALKDWSQELPTEYRLEGIGLCYHQNRSEDCFDNDLFKPEEFIEGYSTSFSQSTSIGGSGKSYVLLFEDSDKAKTYYETRVNKIKEERGYKEIKVKNNCFGWEQDYFMVVGQRIICYKMNVVYYIILQGSLSSTRDITRFMDQLDKQIK